MADSARSALRLTGVSKAYGRVRALDGMSIDVREGRFFVLFGPSASGKTTTLRTIAGLVEPDAGRVEINGQDMTTAPIASRGVSMVFQSFALYPHLTVFENFAYPLREAKVPSAEIETRVKETAAMLKLSHRLERKPNTLSGGEQQRVALGRSLVRRPKILLLDEPLTNLDAKLRFDTRAELKRLHRKFGMTIVYATPDELEALSMGEEIAVMRDGAVVQTGSPDDLYERPASTYVAAKIGAPVINLLESTVESGGQGLSTPLGRMPFSSAKTSPGERALVGIRPSDIRLADSGMAATVHLIEPQGDVTVISFDAGGQVLRSVMLEQLALGLKPGDAVKLAIDNTRIQVFRASDGLSML